MKTAGRPPTAGGVTHSTSADALECCLRYAEAGKVPTGRTKEQLDAIYTYTRLRAAKQRGEA